MKAENIFKGYGRNGVTRDLAELVVPSDLRPLKKIERTFAAAILADERAERRENGLDVPTMKVRIANLKRSSTYLDVYMTELQRATQPRGVIISYPDGGDVLGRWHGNKWTTDERTTFDWALSTAHKAKKDAKKWGTDMRATQVAVLVAGRAWQECIADLVATLTERAAAQHVAA